MKTALTNPTGYEYIGGTLVKRGLALGSEMATDGALGGAIDSAFRTAYDGGSLEDIGNSAVEGFVGGAIMSPIIGGGMKAAGKGAQKFFGSDNILIDTNGNQVRVTDLANVKKVRARSDIGEIKILFDKLPEEIKYFAINNLPAVGMLNKNNIDDWNNLYKTLFDVMDQGKSYFFDFVKNKENIDLKGFTKLLRVFKGTSAANNNYNYNLHVYYNITNGNYLNAAKLLNKMKSNYGKCWFEEFLSYHWIFCLNDPDFDFKTAIENLILINIF